MPRALRPLLRLALAAVLALLSVGALATAGSAHAQLVRTTPEDGATLDALPAAVVLTFSDPLDPQFVRLRVTGPGGQTGTPASAVKQGTVTVTVPAMGPGAYVVAYRVVSKDGHPVAGQTRFTVSAAATDSPATGTPAAGGTFVPVSPTAVDTPAPTTPSPRPTATPSPGLTTVSAGTLAAGGADGSGPSVPLIAAGIVAAVLLLVAGAWFAVGRRAR